MNDDLLSLTTGVETRKGRLMKLLYTDMSQDLTEILTEQATSYAQKGKRVFYIAPNALSFEKERKVLEYLPQSASFEITVTRFTQMARYFILNTSNPKTQLDDTGLAMIFYKVLSHMDDDELKVYGRLRKDSNFINQLVALSNYAEMVRTAISEKIDVVFAGAGLPLDLPLYLTPESKTKLVPIVSSSRAAKIICDKWQKNFDYLPDAIVVEGPKAGGHLGFKKEQIQDEKYALESLIPEVVAIAMSYKERKDIPVIAAGGISTGEDIARFMQLGASAVQMGSIFVTTQECDASQTFKEVYIHSKPEDVLIIESPVGMPGRAIDGEFIRNVEKGQEKPKHCSFHCIKTCDYQKSPYCIIKALYNAAKGNMKRGYAFAGSNAFLSEKIRSVKEVITTLNNEFLLATCQLAPAKMKT